MSVLDNLKSRNVNRMKDIEEYLEKEIIEILSKKNLNNDVQEHFNVKTGSLSDRISPMFKNRNSDYVQRPSNSYNVNYVDDQLENRQRRIKDLREEYLPFNQEEIKPLQSTKNSSYSAKGEIEEFLLDALMPVIGEWLDSNLERIVYKVVKNTALKSKESINYIQKEMEELQSEYRPGKRKRYYNEEKNNNYSHTKSHYKKRLR